MVHLASGVEPSRNDSSGPGSGRAGGGARLARTGELRKRLRVVGLSGSARIHGHVYIRAGQQERSSHGSAGGRPRLYRHGTQAELGGRGTRNGGGAVVSL